MPKTLFNTGPEFMAKNAAGMHKVPKDVEQEKGDDKSCKDQYTNPCLDRIYCAKEHCKKHQDNKKEHKEQEIHKKEIPQCLHIECVCF